jgi:hypothetical protein
MFRVAIAAWMLFASLIPVHAFSRIFPNWTVSEFQPQLREGGRTSSVAVHPTNRNEMFAASDSGGLFKSDDGGLRWRHVDDLPVIFTESVAYLPSNPDVVLVSARADFKVTSGGGVWRSDDHGEHHWTQTGVGLPGVPVSAYEISAVGENVVVGTSEGLFWSTDGGLSWERSIPFSGDKRVFSVLLTPGNSSGELPRIYAGGPLGIRLGTIPLPADADWVSPVLAFDISSMHAFGRSPLSTSQAFVTDGHVLFRTEDRGSNWIEIDSAPDGTCEGAPFIEAAMRKGFLDLYYGNSCDLHRLAAPVTDGTAQFNDMWQQLTVEHFPRHLAFFEMEPTLLASNGGLHETADLGEHWTYVGGGLGGYNALQITDVSGQYVGGGSMLPVFDLYFATRDNKVWAVSGLGNEPRSHSKHGFFLDAEPRVASWDQSRITYVGCDPCRPIVAKHFLSDPSDVGHSPIPTAGPVLLRPGQRLQNVPNGLDLALDNNLETFHVGFAFFVAETVGIPKVGFADASRDQAIIYQAWRSVGNAVHVLRISGANGEVEGPAMNSFGTMGISRPLPPIQALVPVFAVDPEKGDHLIAADVAGDGRMMQTTNGGDDWAEIPLLTALLTNHARPLRFSSNVPGIATRLPLVTAISFFPDDPSQVLIGTSEGGIYYSANRGMTWAQVVGSERATYVTSFSWASLNTVHVSTLGRGLWRLHNQPIAPSEVFDEFCATCEVVSNDGAPKPPPFDASALVFRGRILGVRTDNRQLREVFVTPGSSVVLTGDPKDLQQDITITESNGKGAFEPLPSPPDGWIVTGVVFTKDDVLTGAAFAKSEMSLPPASDRMKD